MTTTYDRSNLRAVVEFNEIPDELKPAIEEEMVHAGNLIRNSILRKLQSGSKSGRTYLFRPAKPGEVPTSFRKAPQGHFYPVVKRSTPHQASAPGESPATDTGELVSRIVSLAQNGGVETGALTGQNHVPIWLEKGTSYMKARPYFEPSVRESEPEIEDNVARVLNSILS